MSAETLAAEAVASRLERQEEDIRWLWAEVQRLRDEQLNAPYSCQVEGPCLTREVAQLRAENRDLRHRLCRLRLCLAEELSRQATATLESAELAGAQEAGAQVKQPIFIKERLKLFEILKKDHQLLLSIYGKKGDTSNIITVRVADGQTVQGEVWKTTPYQVAAEISQELAESTVIAKVNGELWDLDRPLEGDSSLELLTFDNEEAQAVYWHSSAHILGEAMELHYGGHLCYGPPIENGFYYDMFIEDRAVSSTELSALENICKAIIKEKQPFERLEVSKEILLEMFKNSSTY